MAIPPHAPPRETATAAAANSSSTALTDGLIGRPLLFSAIAISVGAVGANLDLSIIQNSLPGLTRELHVDSATSVWIVTVYMLVMLTLVMPFSALSDRFGYKRSFLWGLLVFIFGSAVCGMAGTFGMMLLGRILQGVGGAFIQCTTTSLIRLVYPRHLMARAIGLNATVVAVSFAAAPSLSALILTHFSWHWLFLMNLPLGAVAGFCGWFGLPDNRVQLPSLRRAGAWPEWRDTILATPWFDVGLNIAFFSLLLIGTEALGRTPLRGAGMLACTALIGIWFVKRQAQVKEPMMPFDLLRERNYAFTIATSFASFAAQGAAFVALPFFMQRTLGLSPGMAGLVLTAWPLSLAVAAQCASPLMRIAPIARLCAVGLILLGAGMIVIGMGLSHGQVLILAFLLMICGSGFGLFQTPNNYVIIASAPADRSGAVSGFRAATRTAGQLIGASLAGLMFLAAQGWTFLDGATLGLYVGGAMALGAACCSISRNTANVPGMS